MFKLKDYKSQIVISDTEVECPIMGCNTIVKRRTKNDKIPDNIYLCENCNIFIYPSTFEYRCKKDNLLWYDDNDKALLDKIFKVKRESRMERDNSEDALTWNIFRYLQKQNLISSFLKSISGNDEQFTEIIYWSYSDKYKGTWKCLEDARKEFGEKENRGSEPDLIIETDKTIYFIEAKFNASNNSKPSNINDKKKYLTGGDKWFESVFESKYQSVAIDESKYELMRFWLQGTWIAKNENKEFYLINLVLPNKEKNIEDIFGKHIIINERNKFIRITWRGIYDFIIQAEFDNDKTKEVTEYIENKISGFVNGKLQKGNLIKCDI